jgi:carbonic anhydrase/acetyltransferase-like protein (isoleucine patch superfamily)
MTAGAHDPIVLFGAGSGTIVDVEESCARLGREIAAIVRNIDAPGRALASDRIVATTAIGPELIKYEYLVPIFAPGHRLAAQRDAEAHGFTLRATIIDPAATVARSAGLGAGSYVNAGAVVAGAVAIGAFAFINRLASIGHHCAIGDFASVGPGAIICGEGRLGRGAVVGAGAVLLPGVTIGNNAVVAAGAVIRAAVPDHCLAAGNPARIVRTGYAGFRGMSV